MTRPSERTALLYLSQCGARVGVAESRLERVLQLWITELSRVLLLAMLSAASLTIMTALPPVYILYTLYTCDICVGGREFK